MTGTLETWAQSVLCVSCGKRRWRRVSSKTFDAEPRICDLCNPDATTVCERPDTRRRNIEDNARLHGVPTLTQTITLAGAIESLSVDLEIEQ